MKTIAVLLLLLAGPPIAAAQQSAAAREACERFALETTTANMIGCQYANYKDVDAELNRTYQSLLSIIAKRSKPQELQTAARSAQRAWLAFRDRTCEMESARVGWDPKYRPPNCLSALTKVRTADLELYAACLREGGESCVLQ